MKFTKILLIFFASFLLGQNLLGQSNTSEQGDIISFEFNQTYFEIEDCKGKFSHNSIGKSGKVTLDKKSQTLTIYEDVDGLTFSATYHNVRTYNLEEGGIIVFIDHDRNLKISKECATFFQKKGCVNLMEFWSFVGKKYK
ncbi:MAG: hypothetical protein HC836_50575, partial [Richelia sp. RM2_1_2]|nr:hypothetical protein [Richelia sp. RM2_1_2]